MKLNTKQKKLWKIAKFFIIFSLLSIPLDILLYINFHYTPLQNLVASLTYTALKGLGFQTDISMYVLRIVSSQGMQIVEISMDSTAWKSLYALAALVIATPDKKWKEKIKFLAFGLPVVFAINILRIVTTIALCATYGFQYFDFVHSLLWREGMILAVVALWYAWLRGINYNIVKNKLSFRWNFGRRGN
jgi:exosortase/archaeosortase family protein